VFAKGVSGKRIKKALRRNDVRGYLGNCLVLDTISGVHSVPMSFHLVAQPDNPSSEIDFSLLGSNSARRSLHTL